MRQKITIAALISVLIFTGCFTPKGDYNLELTLGVSQEDVVLSLSGYSKDPVFLFAVSMARERQQGSDKDFITLFGDSFTEKDNNAILASVFLYKMRDKGVSISSTNEEVLAQIRNEVKIATDKTLELFKKRIESFGVYTERLEIVDNKLHIVFVGIEDPERVTNLFTSTAKLEFWETYKFNEIYQFFDKANEVLKNKQASLEQNEESAKAKAAGTVTENGSGAIAEGDDGVNSLLDQIEDANLEEELSMEDYAKRYPLYAYLTPSYVQQGGQMYPAEVARVGVASIKDTARINNMLEKAENIFPRDLKFAWMAKPERTMPNILELVALKATSRNGGPALGGEAIKDARQDYDQHGRITVDLQMNIQGAQIWKRLTGDNIGNQIAIVLDGYVFSYPNVNDEIPNGRSTISGGNMTVEEAQDLANVLRAGRFPYKLVILEEKVITREQ